MKIGTRGGEVVDAAGRETKQGSFGEGLGTKTSWWFARNDVLSPLVRSITFTFTFTTHFHFHSNLPRPLGAHISAWSAEFHSLFIFLSFVLTFSIFSLRSRTPHPLPRCDAPFLDPYLDQTGVDICATAPKRCL
jgi:hypothetical protein